MRSTYTEHDQQPTIEHDYDPTIESGTAPIGTSIPDLDTDTIRTAAEHIAEQERIDPVPVDAAAPRRTAPEHAPETANAQDDAQDKDEKSGLLGLNPTQVVGGALASCTAAALGGQLGVAGTVAGAALTSITIAVGGAVYTRTIDKTRSGIDTVADRFKLAGTTTTDLPAEARPATESSATASVAPETALAAAPIPGSSPVRRTWRDRFTLRHILVTAAAVFLLAGVVLTGLEAVRGGSVSGGDGTTIGQISRGEVSTSHVNRSGTDTNSPDTDGNARTDGEIPDSGHPATGPGRDRSTEPTTQPTTDGGTSGADGSGTPAQEGSSTDGSTDGTVSGDQGSGTTGSGSDSGTSGSDSSSGSGSTGSSGSSDTSGTSGSGGTSSGTGSGSSGSGSGTSSGSGSSSSGSSAQG